MNAPDFFPPPPAYSEQEFNQKTSHALELSSRADLPDSSQQGLWEEWDDAVFEAAAQARQALDSQSSSGGSTSHPQSSVGGSSTPSFSDNTQPLRIKKQRKSDRKSEPKPPPTWLEEAEYGSSSGRAGSVANATASWGDSDVQLHEVHPGDDKTQAIPPPPFGPPNDGLIRMTYELPQSPIPSPLTSPTSSPASLPRDSAPSGHLQQYNMRPGNHLYSPKSSRQTLPSPPQPSHYPNYPIPLPPSLVPGRNNNTRPRNAAPVPLVHQQRSQTVGQPQVPQVYNPSAFYNPAVSAHLTPLSTPSRHHASSTDHRLWNSPTTQPSQPTLSYAASSVDHTHTPIWSTSSTPSHRHEMTNASHFYPRHLHSSPSQPSRGIGAAHRWATTENDFVANYP